MARYKMVDRSPRFLPVVLEAQLMPGSFEHALDYLIDHEVDLSAVAKRYVNDEAGAPPPHPAGLPKNVLFPYNPGGVSSRAIARPCRPNMPFFGDSRGRHTHIT